MARHNMKYIFTFVLFLGGSLVMLGQVGIHTSNPQEALHLASPWSNIKVEGLSETNNVNNLGGVNTTRVYVNALGDLTLAPVEESIEIVLDSENYLEDTGGRLNQTGNGEGFAETGTPIGGSFTLERDAIVEINYAVSWSIARNNNRRINDGRARIVQTAIAFKDAEDELVLNDLNGNPINSPVDDCSDSPFINCLATPGLIGLSGQFYTNSQDLSGAFQNFHNSATDYVRLPQGTYTACFFAQLSVENTNGVGNVRALLGTGFDTVQIIAYYY